MKRIIGAIILAGIIVAICIASNKIIKKYCRMTKSEIKECLQAAESKDYEALDKSVDKLAKSWQKRQLYMSAFVNNAIIDDITVSVSRIPYFTSEEKSIDLITECAEIKMLIEKILAEQGLSIESFI